MSAAVLAQQPGAPPAPTVEELMRRLEERDALILDLRRRVEALERQSPPADARLSPGGQASASEPVPQAPVASSAEQTPAPAPEAAAPAAVAGAPAAPGQFEVDEEAAERALERALVVTGALLVPPGQADIQPSIAYIRSEQDAPTVFPAPGGGQFIASEQVRRNTFTTALFMRLGLPFDSQLELGIPYRYVDQEVVTEVGFGARAKTQSQGSGFGDLSVGLAKGLLHERGWWPDLIGRLTWDTATGKRSDGNIALGGGFDELQGSLTMTKRQDPLVFTGSLSYGTTLEQDGIKPGDQLGFSVGVLLAASPETSLRAALNQTFIDELKVGDATISGSNQVVGTLSLGASAIVGRGKFFDITAGVGLTDAAPDYSIGASLSIRFDVPTPR